MSNKLLKFSISILRAIILFEDGFLPRQHTAVSKRGEMMNTDPHVLALGSRRIVQAVERQTDATLAPAGLTTAQGLVLLHILAQGEAGTSLTAMHRAFGTSMPTLSGILKCLRRQGYVQAVPCPGDERRKLLFATEQARQLQSFLSCTLQEGSNRLYRGFSQAELQTFARLQQKMLSNLNVPQPKE